MQYGKLIDGNLVLAPRHYIEGDYQISNPTPEMLTAMGYKPVRYTDPPQTDPGYVAVPGWTETAEEIVQTWTVVVEPITEEEALVRYANELTGEQDETLTEATETLIKKSWRNEK